MTLHILDIPAEILLIIFSHLPSQTLITQIPLVCRHFRDLVATHWYWKMHYVHLAGSQPLKERELLREWQEGCIQSEFANAAARKKLSLSSLTGAVGGLDCVHVMHPSLHGASAIIAAGSRDSMVYLWRKRSEEGEGVAGGRSMRSFTGTTLSGHKGWVWSLASDGEHRPQLLCSGAWDRKVKVWDVTVGKEVANIRGHHKAAVLSLCIPTRDQLISSCYDKHVRVMDLRTPVSVQQSHQHHSKPVLCVAGKDTLVYSGSEDKSLCVWDLRAQRLLQKLQLSHVIPSLHLNYGVLAAASGTEVMTYDTSEGTLTPLSVLDSGHQQSITSVFHNLGMIVTSSKDGRVLLHSPAGGHEPLATIEERTSAPTSLDFSRNTLTIAGGDRNVSLWTHSVDHGIVEQL